MAETSYEEIDQLIGNLDKQKGIIGGILMNERVSKLPISSYWSKDNNKSIFTNDPVYKDLSEVIGAFGSKTFEQNMLAMMKDRETVGCSDTIGAALFSIDGILNTKYAEGRSAGLAEGDSSERIATLEGEITVLQEQKSELESQLSAADTTNKELENEIAGLATDNSNLNSQLSDANARLEDNAESLQTILSNLKAL